MDSIGLGRYDDVQLLVAARAFVTAHRDDVSIAALAFIRELSGRLAQAVVVQQPGGGGAG